MTIEAWYMDEDTSSDQRLPRRQSPNVECDTSSLEALGEQTNTLTSCPSSCRYSTHAALKTGTRCRQCYIISFMAVTMFSWVGRLLAKVQYSTLFTTPAALRHSDGSRHSSSNLLVQQPAVASPLAVQTIASLRVTSAYRREKKESSSLKHSHPVP